MFGLVVSFRSMQYDGEMLTMTESQAFADEVLARLFAHYDTVDAVDMANIEQSAQDSADSVLAQAASGLIVEADNFMLLPLEYQPERIGPALALYWRMESPSHGLLNRLRHPQQRFRGMLEDLPDWRWW
jgi:hypothetical protein